MRRLAFPLAVVVVLLALVFLWRLSLAPTRHEVEPMAHVVAPATNAADPKRAAELAPADDADAVRLEDAAVEPDGARTTASDDVVFEVEVVLHATRAPVPGAVVLALPRERAKKDGLRHQPLDVLESTAEHDLAAGVLRAVCDERGVARLVARGEALVLRATAPGLLGFGSAVPRAGARERIELDPVVELRARVVDDAGRPVAGVPVAMATRRGAAMPWYDGAVAESGTDGVARIVRPFTDEFEAATETGLRLAIVQRDRSARIVDLAHPPADPVELVLPVCGSVRARAVAPGSGAGKLESSGWSASITADAGSKPVEAKRSKPQGIPPAEESDDWARWPFVEVGLSLGIDASAKEFERAHADVVGPAVAGEAVDVAVEFTHPLPIVHGVLVVAEQRPLRRVECSAKLQSFRGNGARTLEGQLTTDDEGRFRYVVQGVTPDTARVVLELSARGPAEWLGWGAAMELPLPLALDVDLGVVVASAQAVVLGGLVVDDAGLGVAGATVMVRPDLADPRAKEDVLALKLRTQFATTGADGRFAVFGAPWPVGARVDVSRASYAYLHDLAFEPGTRDARIVLPRAGSIEGALLLAPRVTTEWLHVDCVDQALREAGPAAQAVGARLGRDGDFRVEGLPPGRYELRVRGNAVEPLVTVTDVVVLSDQTATVVPIDLRELFHVVEVAVTGPDGKPVDAGTCAFVEGAGAKPQRVAVHAGRAVLFPRTVPCTIAVGATGLRSKVVEDVRDDVHVELEPGLRVRLALDPSLRVPADAELRATIAHVPSTSGLSAYEAGLPRVDKGWQSQPIAPGAELELVLTDAGKHVVTWSVTAIGDPTRAVELDGTSRRSFEARDTSEEQRFVCAPRVEDLAMALEQLRNTR